MVLCTSPSLSGNSSVNTTDDDLFSGVLLGQQDRSARRAAVKAAAEPIAIAPPTLPAASAKPASGRSLFTLNTVVSPETVKPPVRSREEPAKSRVDDRTPSANDADEMADTAVEVDQVPSSSTNPSADIPPEMVLQELSGVDIVVDGQLSESAWQQIPGFDSMIVVEPDTLADPEFKTHVRIFYTERGLFVAADMEQPPETLIQRLSARDQDMNRDGFGFTLDTSGKGLFGFWFALNLGGSKEDGKVLPERTFSREWDGAWHGATAQTATGWSAEMFIPWSIVAMPSGNGKRDMSFFVSRKVAFRNERYGWPALPFTQARFMSALQPIAMNEVNPTQQWEVFPYAATSADGIYDETDGKVGLNFSWRPAPNMQITGAVNPDFGAVESDDVVVNLTAYETFFPEKRLFFLEGSEVFHTSPRSIPFRGSSRGSGARVAPSTFISEPTTVLNTRRIGGSAKHFNAPDGIDVAGPELSKPTDLLGAVKVVGQTRAFRYGLLGAFEDDVEFRGTDESTGDQVLLAEPGRDFGVARILWERQVGTGRQAHGFIGTLANTPEYRASVHGFDSHFLTQNGKMTIDTQLLNSEKESVSGYGGFADIRYTPRQGIFHRISLDYLDDKLDVRDLGFLRRNDLRGIRYTRFNNKSRGLPEFLRSRSIGLFLSAQTNANDDLIRAYAGTGLGLNFANQSSLDFQVSWRPELVDDRSSYGNGDFELSETRFITVTYGSDSSNRFSYSLQTGLIDDDLGDPAYLGDIGFSFNPVSQVMLDYDLRYRDSSGWLIYGGDREFTRYYSEQLSHLFSLDYFITARQQFRVTLQWTGINATPRDYWYVPEHLGQLQPRTLADGEDAGDFTISRLTAQVRYRWEIAPLSDLFVVYTRGSNVPSLGYAEFDRLFREALSEPIVDIFVVKLRYRFGS